MTHQKRFVALFFVFRVPRFTVPIGSRVIGWGQHDLWRSRSLRDLRWNLTNDSLRSLYSIHLFLKREMPWWQAIEWLSKINHIRSLFIIIHIIIIYQLNRVTSARVLQFGAYGSCYKYDAADTQIQGRMAVYIFLSGKLTAAATQGTTRCWFILFYIMSVTCTNAVYWVPQSGRVECAGG